MAFRVICGILCLTICGFSLYNMNSIENSREEVIRKQVVIIEEQADIIKALEADLNECEDILSHQPKWMPVEMELSYYTTAPDEGSGAGITASGTKATVGRTIASNGYPFGTKVMIDGHVYTVEDRGSDVVNNCLDILVESKEEAMQKGRHIATVYVLRKDD